MIDKYNQIYTRDELLDLANLLNVPYDILLSAINIDNKLANSILEKQGYLWVAVLFQLEGRILIFIKMRF